MTENEQKLADIILTAATSQSKTIDILNLALAYQAFMGAIAAREQKFLAPEPLEARLESTDIGGGFDKIIARLDRIELALLGPFPQRQALHDHDDSSHTD